MVRLTAIGLSLSALLYSTITSTATAVPVRQLQARGTNPIYDVFSEILPRVQEFDEAASALTAESTPSDYYNILRSVKDVTAFDIRSAILHIWPIPALTDNEAAALAEVGGEIQTSILSAVDKLNARLPDIANFDEETVRSIISLGRAVLGFTGADLEKYFWEFTFINNRIPIHFDWQFRDLTQAISGALTRSSNIWTQTPIPSRTGGIAPRTDAWRNAVLVELERRVELAKSFHEGIVTLAVDQAEEYYIVALEFEAHAWFPDTGVTLLELNNLDPESATEAVALLKIYANTILETHKFITTRILSIRKWDWYQIWGMLSYMRDQSQLSSYYHILFSDSVANLLIGEAADQARAIRDGFEEGIFGIYLFWTEQPLPDAPDDWFAGAAPPTVSPVNRHFTLGN